MVPGRRPAPLIGSAAANSASGGGGTPAPWGEAASRPAEGGPPPPSLASAAGGMSPAASVHVHVSVCGTRPAASGTGPDPCGEGDRASTQHEPADLQVTVTCKVCDAEEAWAAPGLAFEVGLASGVSLVSVHLPRESEDKRHVPPLLCMDVARVEQPLRLRHRQGWCPKRMGRCRAEKSAQLMGCDWRREAAEATNVSTWRVRTSD